MNFSTGASSIANGREKRRLHELPKHCSDVVGLRPGPKVTKETVNGEKCTLEGTAKSNNGFALKGKVFLVREDGAWKLDEQG